VRLIDEQGEMLGVVPIAEALRIAEGKGLDLVEISPHAEPPVCKTIDFGKYKYQLQKKEHEKRKHQKIVQTKEIKLRPAIGEHDYQVKLKSAIEFLKDGDKVKVSLRFRGREITHQEIGFDLLNRFKTDTEELAKLEMGPKMEGRQAVMVLAPNKTV
jgi:translation initiation factor IF-3